MKAITEFINEAKEISLAHLSVDECYELLNVLFDTYRTTPSDYKKMHADLFKKISDAIIQSVGELDDAYGNGDIKKCNFV